MKYYTGKGDDGKTSLADGRVPKDNKTVQVIGEIDDLSAKIGAAYSLIEDNKIKEDLKSIESDLYLISAELSGYLPLVKNRRVNPISSDSVKKLEALTDSYSQELKDTNRFVYPNGTQAATSVNICRTQTRRVERALAAIKCGNEAIKPYINRLSSFFFVLFRWLNQKVGFKEDFF